MTIWVTGTVDEILNDTDYSRLFTISTEEGEKLIMSAKKGNGVEIAPGATNTFECELFARSIKMPSGKEIFRNHINVNNVVPTAGGGFDHMIQAFQRAREGRAEA